MTTFSKMTLALPVLGMFAGVEAFNDHLFPSAECSPLKEAYDFETLLECAERNPNGNPFGKTEKQMEWVTMCSGSNTAENLHDLKLSITNQLFGGVGKDGKLTKDDCSAECVYSLTNREISTDCQRTEMGFQCNGYVAYHWLDDDKCWERTTADWCISNYEMPRFWAFDTVTAMTWEFPAFKVHRFCAEEEVLPSNPPTEPPTDEPTWEPTAEHSMLVGDEGECRDELPSSTCNTYHLLGQCSIPETQKFCARTCGTCVEEPAKDGAKGDGGELPAPGMSGL